MRTSTLLVIGAMFLTAPAFSQIQITMASLRASATSSSTYFISDAGRQGLFYYDASDLTSTDNGGTVIVSGTKRFKRMYSGPIDVRWFGMKADWNGSAGSDNTAAFLAAINAAGRNQVVQVPQGGYFVKGSIALPLTRIKNLW
jgi:polygalacturonase